MSNIERYKQAELAMYQPDNKAKDIRKQMLNIPEVMQSLTIPERKIFIASTKETISDIDPTQYTENIGNLAKYITQDAGIKKVDEYELTRFKQLLKSYYSQYTLQEVRLAFELAMIGELDDYLPKDRNGIPDKNHYQSFSIEYITKILNAYSRYRNEAQYKAHKAIPASTNNVSHEERQRYKIYAMRSMATSFLRYKYTGVYEFKAVEEYMLYNKLDEMGIAEPVIVTEADKQSAVNNLLHKSREGLINDFVASCIRKMQTKHSEVDGEAYNIARKRALRKTFDEIIKNEEQIIQILLR